MPAPPFLSLLGEYSASVLVRRPRVKEMISKVIVVSTGAKLLPILLFPPQFSVKPKHFLKCLGMGLRHLIFRLEISFCWRWSPLAMYLTYIQVEGDATLGRVIAPTVLWELQKCTYGNCSRSSSAVVE